MYIDTIYARIISGLKLFTTGSTVNLKHSKMMNLRYTVQVGHLQCVHSRYLHRAQYSDQSLGKETFRFHG